MITLYIGFRLANGNVVHETIGSEIPPRGSLVVPRQIQRPASVFGTQYIVLISLHIIGAGEGIRTLDPNLGKREITASL
jgi:hypothetical protein